MIEKHHIDHIKSLIKNTKSLSVEWYGTRPKDAIVNGLHSEINDEYYNKILDDKIDFYERHRKE